MVRGTNSLYLEEESMLIQNQTQLALDSNTNFGERCLIASRSQSQYSRG